MSTKEQINRAIDGKNPTDLYDFRYLDRVVSSSLGYNYHVSPESNRTTFQAYTSALKLFTENKLFSGGKDVSMFASQIFKFECEQVDATEENTLADIWELVIKLNARTSEGSYTIVQALQEMSGKKKAEKSQIEVGICSVSCQSLEEVYLRKVLGLKRHESAKTHLQNTRHVFVCFEQEAAEIMSVVLNDPNGND